MTSDLVITLNTPAETEALARRVAVVLGQGDVLLLQGEIGAGKSHFARSAIDERLSLVGAAEDIPSPTFTLVQVYHAGTLEIWHCDLYRLSDPDEAAELGLQEAFDSALCFVEWPERLGPDAPQGATWLRFSFGDEEQTRRLIVQTEDARIAKAFQTHMPTSTGREVTA